jgi:hypothetical protein
MTRPTLRAVELAEGGYRLAVQPPDTRVVGSRVYERAEVEQLAERLDAELRWVSAPTATRRLEVDPGAASASNTDPWGGVLPPDGEP